MKLGTALGIIMRVGVFVFSLCESLKLGAYLWKQRLWFIENINWWQTSNKISHSLTHCPPPFILLFVVRHLVCVLVSLWMADKYSKAGHREIVNLTKAAGFYEVHGSGIESYWVVLRPFWVLCLVIDKGGAGDVRPVSSWWGENTWGW